ncbi:hypothetical protein PYCCODRAFT_1446954 [Trametes coccinea BRFM310]|uniref:Uncharacterized protein n=1 Tax=Trametes coccinea (strain BRFM310) TaxID=1353009 RepID=A0A1Y2IGX9_TRAC3|nr:hypothetical protein PYCCODRAFT_1446954 [Trametes coccinea BRFM310]
MSTTLPSFVELMASLGLGGPDDAPAKPAAGSDSRRHSRSSSHSSSISHLSASSTSSIVSPPTSNIYSSPLRTSISSTSSTSTRLTDSPAIVVSSHEASPERDLLSCEIRRSRATTRYSPYGSISHSRKQSMPVLNAERTYERPIRALSTSPRLSPISTSFRGRRSKRPDNLNLPLSDADLMAYTPISSYVRRKTPQNSPTSPTFARDRDAAAVSTHHPLTIPALPTLLSPASFTTQSSDSEDDEMDAVPDSAASFRLGQSPQVVSSPPWQSRYCDSGVSPRISVCAPLAPDEVPRPQAVPIA